MEYVINVARISGITNAMDKITPKNFLMDFYFLVCILIITRIMSGNDRFKQKRLHLEPFLSVKTDSFSLKTVIIALLEILHRLSVSGTDDLF